MKGDVRADVDARGEGVDAGRQSAAADFAASDFFPQGVVVDAICGVGVRCRHVKYRGSQKPWSGNGVVRSVGHSRDLQGRRRRSTSGQAQAETGHCCRGEGRDGDVACDGGRWHSGDASLREDRVVAGSPKVDSCFVGGQLALLYTSDGLGIFRKRVDEEDCRGEEENEAAGRFGKVHRCLFMIQMAARL